MMASPGSAKKYYSLPRRLPAHNFNNPMMFSGIVQHGDNRGFSIAFLILPSLPPSALKSPAADVGLILTFDFLRQRCSREQAELIYSDVVTLPAGNGSFIQIWGVPCGMLQCGVMRP
jgi:hypothetical protein